MVIDGGALEALGQRLLETPLKDSTSESSPTEDSIAEDSITAQRRAN